MSTGSVVAPATILEREFARWLPTVWSDEVRESPTFWRWSRCPEDQSDDRVRVAIAESIERLQTRWEPIELDELVAAMYLQPSTWRDKEYPNGDQQAMLLVLGTYMRHVSPSVVLPHLTHRFQQILKHPSESVEKGQDIWPYFHRFLTPSLPECLELLGTLPPSDERLRMINGLIDGTYNMPVRDPHNPKIRWSYQLYSGSFGAYLPRLLEVSAGSDTLSYERFRHVVLQFPELFTYLPLDASPPQKLHVSAPFEALLRSYAHRAASEFAEHLSPENTTAVRRVIGLKGSQYLLHAARHHMTYNLGRLVVKDSHWRDDLDAAIIHLARATEITPAEPTECADLVFSLQAFPPATLKYLLPINLTARSVVCRALGWEQALPLIDLILHVASEGRDRTPYGTRDIPNSPDPTNGVLDVRATCNVLAAAGEAVVREVLELFRGAQMNVDNVLLLIEAVVGWNRAMIEQRIQKRNQVPLKAYGLLPLQDGPAEVRTRYLFLKQFAKESAKFGAERQANERAAVQVALTNLAQVAGYSDAVRLEWAMESSISEAATAVGRAWVIDEYRVEVTVGDAEPQLIVQRGAQQLRAVPPAVRKAAVYADIKQTLTQLKSQASRFRRTFEAMLARGERLSPDDVVALARLPIASSLLCRLILCTDAGTLGLYDSDTVSLRTIDGRSVPIDQPIRIAHPWDLFQAGQLAAWQQEIVHQRIVQPCKQAFRELYLLTPAEEETRTYSNRFAGHLVDSRIASRLFQARDWQVTTDEWPEPVKLFREVGLRAIVRFPDAGHYLSEQPVITSDTIRFERYPRSEPMEYVPLVDVPPLVFSEVMRDADLVVSVAQREGHAHLSAEAYQRRGELVTAVLNDLALPGVRVEGHFAYVQGRRARYRVHLGSAVIHIDPGNYLCIVPARWGQRHDRLFLPFADEGDAKISEVISKVLLLVRDDRITDQSILRQIAARSSPADQQAA